MQTVLKNLSGFSNRQITLIGVMLAVVFTEVISAVMSLVFYGRVTLPFIVTGLVAGIIVSAVILMVLVPALRKLGKAEADLKGVEEKFQDLLEKAHDAILITGSGGTILYSNEMAQTMLGWSGDELLGMNLRGLLAGNKAESVFGSLMKSGSPTISDVQILNRNGEELTVEMSSTIVEFGGMKAVFSMLHDLTPRMKAEKKVAEVERNLASFLERTTDLYYRADSKGYVQWVSPAATRLFGYTPEEAVGLHLPDLYVDPGERQRFLKELEDNGGTIQDFETRMKRRDGTVIWVATNASFFVNEKGEIAGVEGVTRDITYKKTWQEALQESEEKYRTLINSMQDGVFLIQDAKMVFVNENFARMLGYSPDEIVDKPITELVTPEDRDMVLDRYRRRVAGENAPNEYEFTMMHRDGITRVTVNMVVTLSTFRGKPASTGTVKDITERKKMEQELMKAHKLESLSVLAGGIAHDFNNLLTAVLGNISLASSYEKLDDEHRQILSEAITATRRAKELTRQLQTFAKGGEPEKVVVNFAKLLSETVPFALRGTRSTHTLQIADDLKTVEADEGQLNQVINNLLINADQAMPQGGEITVTAANTTVAQASGLPLEPGEYVSCSVRDHGTGIRKEEIDRIFDPYYTSKKKGSGLGLATSQSIIRNHRGFIDVQSEPGKWTCFTIYLPASGKTVKEKASGQDITRGEGRILVMDDEKVVRDVVSKMLKRQGYTPTLAADGNEAMGLYLDAMAEGKKFDAVIFDITIPGGMSGPETLKELQKVDREIKAIVSSGYTADPIMDDPVKYGFMAAIPKPFELKVVADTVAETLAGVPPVPSGTETESE